MWILQNAEATPDTPVTFRVRSGAVKTIGRAARSDFILEAPLVSRVHCRIEAGAENLEVVDLASTNGTFVNGKRVQKAKLKKGDRLRVGRVELIIGRAREPLPKASSQPGRTTPES